MKSILSTTAATALALLAVTACADLDVANPNDPDAGRALETAADVESLIAGSFNTWFGGYYSNGGPGPFLSSQSFQHSSTPANFAMFHYSGIPRVQIANDPAAGEPYDNFSDTWDDAYAALAAVRDGFIALEDAEISGELGAQRVQRARAFGRFVQGMAHASLAVLYDQAFIVDETVETLQPELLEPAAYADVMAKAITYFDQAITLSEGADFTLPASWMFQTETSAATFVQVAHSERARFRAAVARTPAERADVSTGGIVDWNAVIADVEAGVPDGWLVSFNADFDWYNSALRYMNRDGWSQLSYFILGMADKSGNYQMWLSQPLDERTQTLPNGEPFLIITPDQRFPQGGSLEEQLDNPGTVWMVPCAAPEGVDEDDLVPGDPCYGDFAVSNSWVRPARGRWRWSYYWGHEYGEYAFNPRGDLYEIDADEMRLLKAEGLYWTGKLAEAAELVNVSRTKYGLNATDAGGTNTSCVPKLPDTSCGDLFEMLKWEKRNEARMVGLFSAPWFFDSRGWGDLYAGTPLQFPMPCVDLDILGRLPCYTFGGVGGEFASVGSSYGWSGEL